MDLQQKRLSALRDFARTRAGLFNLHDDADTVADWAVAFYRVDGYRSMHRARLFALAVIDDLVDIRGVQA